MGKLAATLFLPSRPHLQPPIDFKYLDESRIGLLYSQIVPELIEKERSVATDDSKHLKASAAGGPVSGEIAIEHGAQVKSDLKREEFSAQRKCLEVVNVSLEQGQTHYYVDGALWFIERSLHRAREQFEEARRKRATEPITQESLEKLRLLDDLDRPPTVQELKEKRRIEQLDSAAFEQEMWGLSGLVLIEGEFRLSTTNGQQMLTREFSQKPQKIKFQILFPTSAHLERMFHGDKGRLHVFASVDQTLSPDGVIGMRGLAVY